MPAPRVAVFSLAVLWLGSCLPAAGQSVISVRSGLVHYFEGAVSIEGRPLEHQAGKFPSIPEGAELRTAQGRVEVLLTPGVMLRAAENSAIRMSSSDLLDTRVELLAGSAILEAAQPQPDNSVTLIFQQWRVRVPRQAVYRIDSEPPRLRVYSGAAEVSTGQAPATVKAGETLPLAEVLVPEKSAPEAADAFTDWAMGRSQVVSADNATAAQIVDDPVRFDSAMLGTSPGTWLPAVSALPGFTYYPLMGTTTLGGGIPGIYRWNSWAAYASGIYSPYLPRYPYGYTHPYPGGSGGLRYPTLPSAGRVPHFGGSLPHGAITPAPIHVPSPHPHIGHAGHR